MIYKLWKRNPRNNEKLFASVIEYIVYGFSDYSIFQPSVKFTHDYNQNLKILILDGNIKGQGKKKKRGKLIRKIIKN